MSGNRAEHQCPECKNNYSTAYSMYRHMRKVHNCDTNRCVTLYCPIENCNQSYDRYNALDTHLSHAHFADIRKEQFTFSDLQNFETWLRDITSSSKTKYIKRSCNNSYRYYRCHRSGLPKTSTDKISTMKSSVKIGRHCPSRIIAKITERNVQVEFVPTHIGHECEIAKIPLSQKKRHDIACRLATSNSNNNNNNSSNSVTTVGTAAVSVSKETIPPTQQSNSSSHINANNVASTTNGDQSSLVTASNDGKPNLTGHQQQQTSDVTTRLLGMSTGVSGQLQQQRAQSTTTNSNNIVGSVQTDSTIISDDTSHMITLAPMKTSTTSGAIQQEHHQQQRHPQIGMSMQQQSQQPTHIMQVTPMNSQLANSNSGNPNMSLMSLTSPDRQELTSRFEQLMASIRSDKHASIVKAQLEVCFALIRD